MRELIRVCKLFVKSIYRCNYITGILARGEAHICVMRHPEAQHRRWRRGTHTESLVTLKWTWARLAKVKKVLSDPFGCFSVVTGHSQVYKYILLFNLLLSYLYSTAHQEDGFLCLHLTFHSRTLHAVHHTRCSRGVRGGSVTQADINHRPLYSTLRAKDKESFPFAIHQNSYIQHSIQVPQLQSNEIR